MTSLSLRSEISISNFSQVMTTQLRALEKEIKQAVCVQAPAGRSLGYFEVLHQVHEMTAPLFQSIDQMAKKAGFMKVERLAAFPKGLCENFVFAVVDQDKVTHVILAKNEKRGFLQNGGGKTTAGESSREAAIREAQEEFTFPGTMEQMIHLTYESRSNIRPSFHFVKGVHLALITPDEAKQLRLNDDMKGNVIEVLTLEQFLKTTEEDRDPKDHGFDRKWIAKFLRNEAKSDSFLPYSQHEITEEDCAFATAEELSISSIQVHEDSISRLKSIMQEFISTNLDLEVHAEETENWKKKRDDVRKAAQGVVDSIIAKLIGPYGHDEKICHVKVQDAAGVYLNGQPIPSFFTIPQMLAIQERLPLGRHSFELIAVETLDGGQIRNIITRIT